MKLIGSALSPYAVRVMLAARYKGIDLPLEAAGTEHRSLNPIGKVPVLVDGSLVLPESEIILEYLEDRFPKPTLLPGDATRRANARLLARLLDVYSAPSFGPFIAQPGDPEAIAAAIARIDAALGHIDHFRIDGTHASGDAFSVADCALIPFFHAFEGLDGPFHLFDLVRQRPKLEAWWSRARTSDLGAFANDVISKAVAEFFRARSSS